MVEVNSRIGGIHLTGLNTASCGSEYLTASQKRDTRGSRETTAQAGKDGTRESLTDPVESHTAFLRVLYERQKGQSHRRHRPNRQ